MISKQEPDIPSEAWHDLSHTFEEGMPVPDWPGEPNQEFGLRSFRIDHTGGFQDFARLNLHSGTHVDSPGHYAEGHASIDQVMFHQLMGPCLVLDAQCNPLQALTIEDLESSSDEIGTTEMLFIRTGWEEEWSTPRYKSEYPFLDPEVGPYLIDRGIRVLGLDTPGPDAPLRSGARHGSPLHDALLGNDMLIIENLANLTSVVGRRVHVYAFPLKIKGAFGGPARVIARELEA